MFQKKAFVSEQEFLEAFSARVNDKVECVEMAELRAPNRMLGIMGLVQDKKTESVWGMIIVCQKSLYFYVPEQEKLFMSLTLSGAQQFEEKIFCFNNLVELRFNANPKKWYNFFSPQKIGFTYLADGQTVNGEFYLSENSENLLVKMRAILSR